MSASAKRVAVVTGAAQGLGRVTAHQLAAAGYDLLLLDLQPLDSVLQQLQSAGQRAIGLSGDVADETFVTAAAARLRENFGGADVLVNNAGISQIIPAEDLTAAQWRRVMDVNLLGPFLLCREFGKQMLQRGRGSIVNVASVAGLRAVAHRSAYNTSKHGLIGLTRTLAAEWGARGVRVNAVCPGWIKTEMDEADQGSGNYTDADIVDRVPMARFAKPEDIAAAIVFLADERSGFINGVSLPVDGGWTADIGWESLRRKTRTRSNANHD
ncbi:MAG: SDR family oxidoreductase [Gammaproteobacteria bacterium]|nr:SDR family oxidoreductase [Gammaproteobacteria bacterium]